MVWSRKLFEEECDIHRSNPHFFSTVFIKYMWYIDCNVVLFKHHQVFTILFFVIWLSVFFFYSFVCPKCLTCTNQNCTSYILLHRNMKWKDARPICFYCTSELKTLLQLQDQTITDSSQSLCHNRIYSPIIPSSNVPQNIGPRHSTQQCTLKHPINTALSIKGWKNKSRQWKRSRWPIRV